MLPHKDTPSWLRYANDSLNFMQTEKVKQNHKTVNMLQTKKQVKNIKNSLMKQINNLSDKEFKAIVKTILTELRKRIDEHNFNKELENE